MPLKLNPDTGLLDLSGGGGGGTSLSDTETIIYDEFIGHITTATSSLEGWLQFSTSGTFNSSNASDNSGHPGVWSIGVTTAANSFYMARGETNGIGGLIIGGGAIRCDFVVHLGALSTVTEEYEVWIGLLATSRGTPEMGNDGIGFEYQRLNSTDWSPFSIASSSRSDATGGTPTAVAADWVTLRFDINADGTNIDFFIDGVDAGSITTNINTSVGVLPVFKIFKIAGTELRFLDFDAFRYFQKLTNVRMF